MQHGLFIIIIILLSLLSSHSSTLTTLIIVYIKFLLLIEMQFSFVLVFVVPFTAAYRDGAQAGSCYDHAINHTSPGNPPVSKFNCPTPCPYELILDGAIDEMSLEIVENATFILECGSIYQCKHSCMSLPYIYYFFK